MPIPIYNWAIIACWAVFVLVWFFTAFGAKRSAGNVWRYLGIRAALIIVAIVLVGLHGPIPLPAPYLALGEATTGSVLGLIGVILCAAGVAFAVWARFTLGRNWGMPMTVRAEPELVTAGPYAYVRHPIYTGAILAVLGTAVVTGLIWGILFLVICAYFTYSAFAEEKTLTKIFPTQYPEYKKRTKMLIPFLL